MNFTSQMRYNPETGEYEKYYRLKESYRNASHASRQRVVTRCTYYERYTTEEALQAAAKSYGGLTGEDK